MIESNEDSRDESEIISNEKYLVSKKKTIMEYKNLDKDDVSLERWKNSLGLDVKNYIQPTDPNDKRIVVLILIKIVFSPKDNFNPIEFEFENFNFKENKKLINFQLKEKSCYQMVIRFKIQHEIVSCLKYCHVIKKHHTKIEKFEQILGSYAPNNVEVPYYEKKTPMVEVPHGYLARGSYSATTNFCDEDNVSHLTFPWYFSIIK